ncbi:MAG: DUF2062 domain-containing protein [Sulfuricellaceae bacterium]
MSRVKEYLFRKFISPIIQSESSCKEISLGVGVGVFVALTPTEGFQAVLLFLSVLALRTFGIKADWKVGLPWLFLTNPTNIFPLYFLYYKTGNVFLAFLGGDKDLSSYQEIKMQILSSYGQHGFTASLSAFWQALGVATFIGSFVYALPVSLFYYRLTSRFVDSIRNHGIHGNHDRAILLTFLASIVIPFLVWITGLA